MHKEAEEEYLFVNWITHKWTKLKYILKVGYQKSKRSSTLATHTT